MHCGSCAATRSSSDCLAKPLASQLHSAHFLDLLTNYSTRTHSTMPRAADITLTASLRSNVAVLIVRS